MTTNTTPQATSPRLLMLSSIRLASNGSFRFLYPFLPVVAPALGLVDAQAGLLVGALALGGVMAPVVRRRLVGGAEQPRRLLAYSSVMVGVGAIAAALAPAALIAVVALFFMGAGKPLVDTAAISYVSARVGFERRGRATAAMEVTWAGSLIVIAPIAGLLASATNWRVPLALLGASVALFGLIAARRLDADPPPTAVDSPGLVATFRELTSEGRWFIAVAALTFATLEGTVSAFGLWLDRVHGIPLEQLGSFAAVMSTGELTGALVVTAVSDRVGKARTLICGSLVAVLGFSVLAAGTSLPVSMFGLTLGLVGAEAAIVATIAIASEVVPSARTRYLALLFAIASLARAMVGAVGPATFAAFGIAGNVAISIMTALLALVVTWRVVHAHPRLR